MKYPPPSRHKAWMKIFQTKSFIKRTCGGHNAAEGIRTPTSSFPKVDPRVLAINSKSLLMTTLEIKSNLTGCMRAFGWELHWELREPWKSHPNALIQLDEQSSPSSHK